MFSIDNILFTLGGQGVSLLELLAVSAGLSCVFLATRGKVLNFWVGYLYNILLFFMFLQKHLYSSMLVQPISFVINFFGHYRWTHPAQNEKDRKEQLKISILTNRERLGLLAVVATFTVCWGFLLSKLNIWWPDIFPMARAPFLDAFVTAFMNANPEAIVMQPQHQAKKDLRTDERIKKLRSRINALRGTSMPGGYLNNPD